MTAVSPKNLHLYHHDVSTHCSALTLLPIDLTALQEVPSILGTTLKTEKSMIRGKEPSIINPFRSWRQVSDVY